MSNETIGSVHRFRDTVAVYIGTGATVYLSTKEAVALARALNACSRDIKKSSFVNSEFKTTDIKRGER